jgi:hypothetical protein
MPTFVDDSAVALEGSNLNELLGAAQQHLAPSGRVVVDVVVEGESLDGEQLGEPEKINTEGREVRLYTADPAELAVSTLRQVRQRLTEAEQIQKQAAELLQQDQPSEALQQVSAAVEVWLQTQQAVQHSAELLQLDLNEMTVDGAAVSAIVQQLADQLHQLKDTLNDGDTVGLADALAYEWPETVQQWDRLVQTLIERIEQQ